jgi:PAS domain S-box-containing protein
VKEKEKTFEHLLQVLIDAIPIPIFYKDMQGRYLGCNAEFERYIGSTKDRIIGKSVGDVAPGALKNKYYEIDDALISKIGRQIDEDSVVYANGTRHDVIFNRSIFYDENGMPGGLVGVILDITERKEMESSLHESRRRQRAILDNIPDLAWLKDTESRYIAVNRSYSLACGMPPEMLIGKTDFDIWPKDLAEKYWSDDREVMQAGQRKVIEETMISKDGELLWGETIKTPIYAENGKIAGTAGIARDITLRKQTEIKLRALQDDLRSLALQLTLAEEKERRRIAIELHDHVGQNLAYCKIILSGLEKDNPSPLVSKPINELMNLVTETIQFTRSVTFELSPPVLHDLGLEQSIEWLGEQVLARKDIHFRLDNDGLIEPISQELKILLFQILRELLANVAKHSQAKETLVFVRKTGNSIMISVQDDGIGFDVSTLTDGKQGPTGYGLFSIRERLKLIDGYFDIKSTPGSGTVVNIMAPISP